MLIDRFFRRAGGTAVPEAKASRTGPQKSWMAGSRGNSPKMRDRRTGAADAAAGASRCKMRIARARSRACARVARFDRKTILHVLYSYGYTRATG